MPPPQQQLPPPPTPKLVPIDPPAGIVRDETQYRAAGRWWNCDKVRFRNGRPEAIGGWEAISNPLYGAPVRSLTRIVSYGYGSVIIAGTSSNLQVMSPFDELLAGTQLPPASYAVTLQTDPIVSQLGIFSMYVPDMWKFSIGDTVTLSGLTTFAGNPTGELNTTYIVVGFSNRVHLRQSRGYSFALGTGGGSSATATVSFTDRSATARAYVGRRFWSMIPYGQALIACDRNGPLFYWDGGVKTIYMRNSSSAYNDSVYIGTEFPTANLVPSAAICVGLGKDRSVIAFGCNDPLIPITVWASLAGKPYVKNLRLVAWSDNENPFEWEPREDTTAGSFEIQSGSYIITAQEYKTGHVIFMDTCLVYMKWVGAPAYYAFEKISDGVSIIGPNAAVSTPKGLFWMGVNNFYVFNGSVSVIPCTVSRYVFSNINRTDLNVDADVPESVTPVVDPVAHCVATAHFAEQNEVWWFYPTGSSIENDSYVVYNYVENWWSIGTMFMSACLDGEARNPIMAGGHPVQLYKHDYLYSINNVISKNPQPVSSYIESGGMDIGEGDSVQHVSKLVPDFGYVGTAPTLTYEFKTREWPMEDFASPSSGDASVTATTSTKWKDLRIRAREMRLKISASSSVGKWFLGKTRVAIQSDGRR